jgi:integrase
MVDQYRTNPAYTFKRNDIYYFTKRIPHDLKYHYKNPRLVKSLRTRSESSARQSAIALSNKLETYWEQLRVDNFEDIPFSDCLYKSTHNLSLNDALNTYFESRPNKSKLFYNSTARHISYLIEATADKPIKYFTTVDATTFRDWLKAKGLANASIKKAFACIKAIFSLAIQEHGLAIDNPFSNIHLPSPTEDAKKRIPISTMDSKLIQTECTKIDDDLRWLVALISDTGMRLAEATGLKINDLVLDDEIPHVIIQPHSHRPLKTRSSERVIPLVGASLWAAQRIKRNVQCEYCFPRYTNNDRTNANSASAALNKWIKVLTNNRDNTIHGFRHKFRDRLRAVNAPLEMIDQIGGWSVKTVGQSYGIGYDLLSIEKILRKVV